MHDICDNADAALDAARSRLAEHLSAGASPVLLVPSPAAALRVRRALVGGPGSLGARVETFDAWVADRWELFGDGRRIVEERTRALLVRRALEEPSPGAVELAAALAREALPQLLLARGSEEARALLTDAERALLDALARYAALLAERGLIEASEAADALPDLLEPPDPLLILGFDELPCALERLAGALSGRAPVERFDDGCRAPSCDPSRAPELQALLGRLYAAGEPVEPTGAVRFLLPAGRYAAPALVLRCAADAAARERAAAASEGRAPLPVAVAARDPRALFDDVAAALLARGCPSAVSARRAFSETAFGRTLLALLSFDAEGACRVAQASDFALSAFSGISARAAASLDAAWRADRTVDAARIRRDLSSASEAAAEALAALAEGDLDRAVEGLERRIRARADFDPAFRAEQLAAASSARAFAAACAEAGTAFSDALAHLECAAVPASARTGADRAPEVVFLSLAEAAERPACSCASLLLCDLEAGSYPVRAVEDGRTLLLEKLGLRRPADALADARRRFFRALSAARDEVACERVLNTADADEAYPAVMLEELLDCYLPPQAGTDGRAGIDRATGLPARLVPFAEAAGEESLQTGLALAPAAGRPLSWDVPASGAVSEQGRPRIVLPPPNAPAGAPATLSPSAVETYLECPYKWFALRRLRASEPDVEFGPKEKGSFSHAVLKGFYERFREAGYAKVGPESLGAARAVLDEVFDERLAAQPGLRPKENPLIARTKLEEAEIDDLRRKLATFVEREPLLLPGFEPRFFELDFGAAEPFEYGGFLLRGSVDRIDVNGRGQAVVIDYKGSLTPDHALGSASPAAQANGQLLPHKVQTLMYAQVARRLLGLDVVGALYVSYTKPKAAGAVDRTVLGEGAVPGLSIEKCGAPGPAAEALQAEGFGQLVDLVEERIASAAARLLEGRIDPGPRGKDPCGYCPVLACESRRDRQ
ncbi:PD-(D/E)XK nuclease family protein [Arabiibacter massiliensis]|uniref:PD-(D/E)XK nuclease family protein n=1 Tax=Arabiibacter massiliensis TaxID=1870985 RepID=UPI001E5B5C15|nr:PD-(D/E)XK nuclease family protein [Arabiibacter massiliensis]